MIKLQGDWQHALINEYDKPYYKALNNFVLDAYASGTVYPPREQLFNAFDLTPLSSVKVLILGQDPYHGENQAHGLAFSVNKGIAQPPSLKNIYKELEVDIESNGSRSGNLTHWAKQGVLLLNTVLTVEAGKPNSHRNKGWEQFTDAVIGVINQQNRPIVIMLWGKSAQAKTKLLNHPKHLILKAPHPSPLSAYRGFFGCHHFSQANQYLIKNDVDAIIW